MKMIKSTLSLLAAVVIFASCNQFQKSPSGMPYKITKGNSKELLKHGQFVKLNIEYKLKSKDTILNTSYGHIPMYFYLDSARLGKYTFTEVITKCAPGDKMEFSLSIDSLKKMGMIEFKEVFEIILFTKEKVFDIIDKKKKAHKLIFNMLKSHEKKIDGLKKVLDEVTSKNCK